MQKHFRDVFTALLTEVAVSQPMGTKPQGEKKESEEGRVVSGSFA